MIIGIDATRANKPQKTGVEWYSYHLIRELARINTKHTLRLYFRNTPEPGLASLGPNVEYRILNWPLKYLWTQARLSWEMLLYPPDLLFIPAQIIPLLHPARTVTTIHDVAFKPYPKSYSAKSRWYLNFAVWLARKLPRILTVSEFSKKEIIKYYAVPPDTITVTPLGFTHESTLPASVVTAKFNIKEPYLLYVGRLERKKNITVAIKAFDLIKRESWGGDFQLVLVGVKGHGWDEIDKNISESSFKTDIKVVGWVTEEEKHTLFAHAKVCLQLSAYEGFGLPLLESMSAKTPIIASDQGALTEIAGMAALIVPRGDAHAVRDALRDIIFDKNLRDRLIISGSERVKKFTWQATAETTLQALDALLHTTILNK